MGRTILDGFISSDAAVLVISAIDKGDEGAAILQALPRFGWESLRGFVVRSTTGQEHQLIPTHEEPAEHPAAMGAEPSETSHSGWRR